MALRLWMIPDLFAPGSWPLPLRSNGIKADAAWIRRFAAASRSGGVGRLISRGLRRDIGHENPLGCLDNLLASDPSTSVAQQQEDQPGMELVRDLGRIEARGQSLWLDVVNWSDLNSAIRSNEHRGSGCIVIPVFRDRAVMLATAPWTVYATNIEHLAQLVSDKVMPIRAGERDLVFLLRGRRYSQH